MKTKKYNFNQVLDNNTRQATKIKKGDYLQKGTYPIIDQGKKLVGGYAEKSDKLYNKTPAIIFGEHTRIVKYYDKPFYIGADGVKVLNVSKTDVHSRYIYYYLKQSPIPNAGYCRHFKYIKELQFFIPNMNKQQEIVKELDLLNEIIENKEKQLEEFDFLSKSIFYKLTNNLNEQKIYWKDVFITTTGKLDANAMVEDGRYPFFTCSKEIFKIDKYAFNKKALLLAGNNATANYDVKYYSGKFNAYQRTYVISLLNEKNSYKFFQFQLISKLEDLKHQSKGSNTKYLTMKILNKLQFYLPPIELQNQFTERIEKIEKQKELIKESIKETRLLLDSYLDKYFNTQE